MKTNRSKSGDKSIGKRYLRVLDPIFNRTIHVFLNYSSRDFSAWGKKSNLASEDERDNYDDDFSGFSTVITRKGFPTEWVICLKNFEWTISNQGTLIHEIVHTVIKIWDHNNIPHTGDTQEFLAHSIGNIFEEISGRIFRVKRSQV